MAYNLELAERIRQALNDEPGISERKMFGGLAFMMNGNMAVGVNQDNLMVRVGKARYEAALAEEHARTMDFTGRPMRGMVFVGEAGYENDAGLQKWLKMGLDFAGSLPAK